MTKNRPDRESQEWSPPHAEAHEAGCAHLRVEKAVLDDFPYPHTDFWVKKYGQEMVERDADKLVFGVPREHEQGMAFYVIDQEGSELVEERPDLSQYDVTEEQRPDCIFHGEACVLTKHFNFSGVSRLQFKCPKCYLTRYIDL